MTSLDTFATVIVAIFVGCLLYGIYSGGEDDD